jgi:hypothetical protein
MCFTLVSCCDDILLKLIEGSEQRSNNSIFFSTHLNKVFTGPGKNPVYVCEVLDGKSATLAPIGVEASQLLVDNPFG